MKLVGATAHYVTADLDEGPIIEQEVFRVDHSLDPDALVTVGRDAEALALSRAVKWHCQHRVLLNGTRTVVFRYHAQTTATGVNSFMSACTTRRHHRRRHRRHQPGR